MKACFIERNIIKWTDTYHVINAPNNTMAFSCYDFSHLEYAYNLNFIPQKGMEFLLNGMKRVVDDIIINMDRIRSSVDSSVDFTKSCQYFYKNYGVNLDTDILIISDNIIDTINYNRYIQIFCSGKLTDENGNLAKSIKRELPTSLEEWKEDIKLLNKWHTLSYEEKEKLSTRRLKINECKN